MSEKTYEILTNTQKAPLVGGDKDKDERKDEELTSAKSAANDKFDEEEIRAMEHERKMQKLILLGAMLQGIKRKPDRWMIH